MSIQAEKSRGLLGVKAEVVVAGGVCLFLFLATKGYNTFPRGSSQRQEYRQESRKASGFSSLRSKIIRPRGPSKLALSTACNEKDNLSCNKKQDSHKQTQHPTAFHRTSLFPNKGQWQNCHPVPPKKEEAVDLPFNNFPKCYK